MKTIYLHEWAGGQTNDSRDPDTNQYRVIKHFDNYTNNSMLVPHRSMKVMETESSMDLLGITKFTVALGNLYGLGVVNRGVDNHTQLYKLVAAGDPTSTWTTVSGATSSSSVETNLFLILYHNFFYGANTGGIWQFGDITGSPSFTYNKYTSHIPTAPGLVHSKDDILYIPSNNLILAMNDSALDGSASFAVALTLPAGSTINAICEDGNYLDIACDQPDGSSVVYQWDRQTTLNTLSEKIDWGAGSLKLIESIGGLLCGISMSAANATALTPKVMFKYWTGARVVTVQEFLSTLITISAIKQKFNNLFYFLAEITIDGTAYKGVWKIYKNPQGNMATSFDRLPRNDTMLDAASLLGFYRWGDYIFVAYTVPSTGAYTIWRTDDQANFLATSIIETTINPAMPEADRPLKKKLISVGATYDPIVAGSATIKYRIDGGAWRTIFTESTVGTVRTEPYTKDTDTNPQFFGDGTEFEFHIETTGGVQPTGLVYKYDILQTNA